MSIETIQASVRDWRGPDARSVEATLEVAKALVRIADALEKLTTPATSVEGPRIAEAECSRCGYRQSYYPEDADLPHGWAAVTGGGGLCGGCFLKVRDAHGQG